MDTFSKDNLIYAYSWSEYDKDDPRVSGIPDSTPFNKKEGEEIVYLINYLSEHLAWSVEEFGAKVEKLLYEHLPEGTISQKETIQWIKENWKAPALASA